MLCSPQPQSTPSLQKMEASFVHAHVYKGSMFPSAAQTHLQALLGQPGCSCNKREQKEGLNSDTVLRGVLANRFSARHGHFLHADTRPNT